VEFARAIGGSRDYRIFFTLLLSPTPTDLVIANPFQVFFLPAIISKTLANDSTAFAFGISGVQLVLP
jgi:hypothetical protein